MTQTLQMFPFLKQESTMATNHKKWLFVTFFIGEITSVPVELVFLFDGSGQVTDADFSAQIAIAKDIADTFNISEGLAHVGAATYGQNSRVYFTFTDPLGGENRTAQAVKELFDRTPRAGGAARLGQGLKIVDSDLFSLKGGSVNFSKVSKAMSQKYGEFIKF